MSKAQIMNKIITALFSVALSLNVLAQTYKNNVSQWCFGPNTQYSFNTNTSSISSMLAREGSASIADANGNLLFYTNGETIWNRNHSEMLNGDSLLGHWSAVQSSIIVPAPDNSNLYYVFTNSAVFTNDGLSYSLVDMTLDNGLGAVVDTEKNITLLNGTTEMLTANFHANQSDIWIVTHRENSNFFYSFLLTSNGIQEPVISNVGIAYGGLTQSAMKLSGNGERLAAAISDRNTVEIYDFNNVSGEVFNPLTITDIKNPYGIEFSCDNTKLYVTSSQAGNISRIEQFDLEAANIKSSKETIIENNSGVRYASLQIGSDQKIYVAELGALSLGLINRPNEKGTSCNYMTGAVSLNGGVGQRGLPNFITGYFNGAVSNMAIHHEGECLEDEFTFTTSAQNYLDISWEIDGSLQAHSLDSFKYQFDVAGEHLIRLFAASYCKQDTISAEVDVIGCDTIVPFVYVPNAFSPNGDGINDVFRVETANLEKFQFALFNRWGKLVFQTSDPDFTWHGEYKHTESYLYQVYAENVKKDYMIASMGSILLVK